MPYSDLIASVERVLLREIMAQAGGNISQAARMIGISRPTLRAKLSAVLPELDRSVPDDAA